MVVGCSGCGVWDGGVCLVVFEYRLGGFIVYFCVGLEFCWFFWLVVLWWVCSVVFGLVWCLGGRWGIGVGKIFKEGFEVRIRDVDCCLFVRWIEKGLGKWENMEF